MERSFQIKMPKETTFDKDFVLKQATNLFREKGYNATSMQDLVEVTGLNRSSIYNTFESKKNLFLECLKSYETLYDREVLKKLVQSNTGLRAIKAIFDMYLFEMAVVKDSRGCLIVNCKSEMANHDAAITNFLSSNQQKALELFEDLVSQGQKDGSINQYKSPKEYALFVYSSLQGFRMTGILVSDKLQLQSIITTVMQTLV